LGDFVFPFAAAEILRLVKGMVETGEPPPITADMLEGVAIAEAARLAQQEGRSVEIAEVGGTL
jgi:predicted dehydrogenase